MSEPDIAERLTRDRPDVVLHRMDYGQELVAEKPGYCGAFIRYGQLFADPARYDDLLAWLDTPRPDRRLTKAEAVQFLERPDA